MSPIGRREEFMHGRPCCVQERSKINAMSLVSTGRAMMETKFITQGKAWPLIQWVRSFITKKTKRTSLLSLSTDQFWKRRGKNFLFGRTRTSFLLLTDVRVRIINNFSFSTY